jgi:MFS family permease
LSTPQVDRSYRALLALPSLGRVLVGMQLARIAQSMVAVAIVLFTLDVYDSPALAGVVVFATAFPGILASPFAGALLDRHGRTRLVILDYLLGAASLAAIAGLSLAGALPAPLLVVIAAISALTWPLSATGLRSLFPLLAPPHLWERANAADSTGYVFASIIGPPVAGAMVQFVGPQAALCAIAAVFVAASLVLIRIPDPKTEVVSTGKLWLDALHGVRYTWRNRTLRGLGFSISILNIGWGILVIAIPLIVLERLHAGGIVVGIIFAVQGIGGVIAAFVIGRLDSRGRERRMLAFPMLAMALALTLLIPDAGIIPVLVAALVTGLLNGPIDIALFTVRQRRTDPAWLGRALAVSMAFNSLGGPIGSAIGGWLVTTSLEACVLVAIGTCAVGALAAWVMVPAVDSEPGAMLQA